MKLSRETLRFALALAAFASGYAWLGIGAHEARFAALDDRVRVAQRRVDEEEERAANLERLLVEVAWLRETLELVRARMQSDDAGPQLLVGLAEVLRAHGLQADAIEPRERRLAPPLHQQGVQLELRGEFARIAALVAAIEGLAPHCRIVDLDLARVEGAPSASAETGAALLRAQIEIVRFASAEP